MNVLLQADGATLTRVKRELKGPWSDLSLIGAAATELQPDQVELLSQRYPELVIQPDREVSLPPELEGPVRPELNIAAPTVHAPELWKQGYKGQHVTVAVVDTGISRHKDFEGRILAFQDFLNGKTEPYDDHGHGTHVAGIVGGDGSDSHGKHVGMAPECGLVALKAFNSEGKSKSSDVIKAIQWAVENRQRLNIKVLNLSAGGKATVSHQWDPMARAVEAAWKQGITVVVAAGNEGPDAESISTPGHSPVVITVGNSDDRGTVKREDDRVNRGSSRGPTPVDHLHKPDLVAPGTNITACDNRKSGYVTKTGTSMAAPMVAGLAAVLLSAHPEAKPDTLKRAFVGSAESLPKGGGIDDQGAGLVDGLGALAQCAPST